MALPYPALSNPMFIFLSDLFYLLSESERLQILDGTSMPSFIKSCIHLPLRFISFVRCTFE
jgi:hypothetical protein